MTFMEDCAAIRADGFICEEYIERAHSGEPWSHSDLALNADHNPVPKDDASVWGPRRFADYHLVDLVNDDVLAECRRQGMTMRQFSDFLVVTLERVLADAKESQRVYHAGNGGEFPC